MGASSNEQSEELSGPGTKVIVYKMYLNNQEVYFSEGGKTEYQRLYPLFSTEQGQNEFHNLLASQKTSKDDPLTASEVVELYKKARKNDYLTLGGKKFYLSPGPNQSSETARIIYDLYIRSNQYEHARAFVEELDKIRNKTGRGNDPLNPLLLSDVNEAQNNVENQLVRRR